MTYAAQRIAWIDFETTGLVDVPDQPAWPLVLEVALVVTCSRLKVLDAREFVIKTPPEKLFGECDGKSYLNDFTREMHTKNGLIRELEAGAGKGIAEVDVILYSILAEHEVEIEVERDGKTELKPYKPVLGGASPGALDRPILRKYFPLTNSALSHRSLDVSTLKLAFRNWFDGPLGEVDSKDEAEHRAMADTLAAIRFASIYRDAIGRIPLPESSKVAPV